MSTNFIFANIFNVELSAPVTSTGQTTLTINSTTNAPTITAGQIWVVVLNDAASQSIYEICYATARTGNVLTVLRGQEGTAATTWLAGDNVYAPDTAGILNNFALINGSSSNNFAAALITATGISVNGGSIYAYNPLVFNATGTFTTPASSSVQTIYRYRIVGGGGGGGGANGNGAAGGGGGAGGYGEGAFSGIAASTGVTITIGTAGTAGSTAGGNGGAGGSTSIGTPVSVTVTGGGGGNGSTASAAGSLALGGGGGTGSGTGIIAVVGAAGSNGQCAVASSVFVAGNGAGSAFGSGGTAVGPAAGNAGVVPGSGGAGGGFTASGGGAGAIGICIIERMTP